MPDKPIVYHIPVCPFSQRLEILLELKDRRDAVSFKTVDITKPRSPELLAKTRGTTALPVLETEDGRILKESLVLIRYLEDRIPAPQVFQDYPYNRAVESMLIAGEGDFVATGYRFVMNQDPAKRAQLADGMSMQYKRLDDFLNQHACDGDFLFDRFGLAEAVFTPFFMRFLLLDYFESFDIPEGLERVRRWRDACCAHPAAQQVSREEIVKLYYDYTQGTGNGALPQGRTVSSFVLTPDWSERPWPPREKYRYPATDQELGLL